MKIPLRLGLGLLVLLLLGIAVSEGPERLVLIMAAMGVALWSAFSLPAPPPAEENDAASPEPLLEDVPEGPEAAPYNPDPDVFDIGPPPEDSNGSGRRQPTAGRGHTADPDKEP